MCENEDVEDVEVDSKSKSDEDEVELSSSIGMAIGRGKDSVVSLEAKRKNCSSASVAGVVSVTNGDMRRFLEEDSSAREDWSAHNFICRSMRFNSGLSMTSPCMEMRSMHCKDRFIPVVSTHIF